MRQQELPGCLDQVKTVHQLTHSRPYPCHRERRGVRKGRADGREGQW